MPQGTQIEVTLGKYGMAIMNEMTSYNFNALLCDIGATLGLFMGLSLITIIEVLEYVIIACLSRIKSRKESSSTVNFFSVHSTQQ